MTAGGGADFKSYGILADILIMERFLNIRTILFAAAGAVGGYILFFAALVFGGT